MRARMADPRKTLPQDDITPRIPALLARGQRDVTRGVPPGVVEILGEWRGLSPPLAVGAEATRGGERRHRTRGSRAGGGRTADGPAKGAARVGQAAGCSTCSDRGRSGAKRKPWYTLERRSKWGKTQTWYTLSSPSKWRKTRLSPTVARRRWRCGPAVTGSRKCSFGRSGDDNGENSLAATADLRPHAGPGARNPPRIISIYTDVSSGRIVPNFRICYGGIAAGMNPAASSA